MIPEIKQIGASVPLGAIEQDANHVEMPRIDRLIRKGTHRRTNGATRPGK
jgi:two-component system nitrate/nitrite response regulator NarL